MLKSLRNGVTNRYEGADEMSTIVVILLTLTVVSIVYTWYNSITLSFDKLAKVTLMWGLFWSGYLLALFTN